MKDGTLYGARSDAAALVALFHFTVLAVRSPDDVQARYSVGVARVGGDRGLALE